MELPKELGTDPLEALAAKIRQRDAVVGVLGLGYVGLPLLVAVHDEGFPVLGFDVDADKVTTLEGGRSTIGDVADSEVAGLAQARFGSDPAVLSEADVLLICVPTPLKDSTPDLSMVELAAEQIGLAITPGTLVVLESTTYPGTTEELVRPIVERLSGLELGRDFALAYSPERIDPGQSTHRIDTTPKVVAGVTERCRELATSFYSSFVNQVVTTSTPREAEMAKLIENTFRQVNIALVNELAIIGRELGVDIWEALEAAATKPFGYMAFWPGPGVGGHCISIDPSYLSWRAGQQLGYRAAFIEHANEVNNRMPAYVVDRIAEVLNDSGKPLRNSKILAIGVAYKPGVDDRRESPSLVVIERLCRKGAEVTFHDPYIPHITCNGHGMDSVELDTAELAEQDCVVILTPHPGIDWRAIANVAPLVFDTRGVTAGFDEPNVVRL